MDLNQNEGVPPKKIDKAGTPWYDAKNRKTFSCFEKEVRRMAKTIQDIAREAKVSIATVSRVINNTKEVSPELKKRVYRVIEENSFRPNPLARGLVTRKSGLIGIVLSDISNNVFGTLTKGIESVCQTKDYTLLVCESGGERENELRLLSTLGERQIDGVLFAGVEVGEELVTAIRRQSYPTVLVTQEVAAGEGALPTVAHDNEKAVWDAVDFLAANGHRRIAFIGGPEKDYSSGYKRLMGYRKALETLEIPYLDSYVEYGSFSFESGFGCMKKIYEENAVLPTAVMACSDLMAVGAIRFLADVGLCVPEHISVMGFDDIGIASYISPELSTVRISYYDEGVEAAKTLFKLMEKDNGKGKKPATQYMPHQIIRRKSVKDIRA